MSWLIITFEVDEGLAAGAELESSLREVAREKGLGPDVLQFPPSPLRDGGITVALVGLAATSLSALIAGLCAIVKSRRGQKVVLKGKDGEVQIPADTPPERIQFYVEQAQKLSYPQVNLPAPGSQK